MPAAFTLPSIAMTAHAIQGDRERCLEAGMNDYVAKPVARQALAAVLSKWLPHAAEEGNGGPDDGGPRGEAVICRNALMGGSDGRVKGRRAKFGEAHRQLRCYAGIPLIGRHKP